MSVITRDLKFEMNNMIKEYPVVTLLGPRQSGKSTLVKNTFPEMLYVNLEQPDELVRVKNDPRSFLESIPKTGAIIDEVQRLPELLSYIQVFVDEKKENGQFVLTGSHQLEMHQAISQSLAGRTCILKLLPLSIMELRKINLNYSAEELILTGFFPKLYKEKTNHIKYYQNYVSTYVEKDVRKMVNVKDLGLFQDFLRIIAGRVGQLINYDNISNEIGVSSPTVKQWVSILEASFLIVKVRPYFENISKRLVKSPKIYFTDPGLLCYLLGIETENQLSRDPLRGSLFENLVVIELIKARYSKGLEHNLYFYRDNHQNEVDLIYKISNQLIPIEIKSSKTFNLSFLKGLKYFKKILKDRVINGYLIYNGDKNFNIEQFSVKNLTSMDEIL